LFFHQLHIDLFGRITQSQSKQRKELNVKIDVA
jgi:hypothetical protein